MPFPKPSDPSFPISFFCSRMLNPVLKECFVSLRLFLGLAGCCWRGSLRHSVSFIGLVHPCQQGICNYYYKDYKESLGTSPE